MSVFPGRNLNFGTPEVTFGRVICTPWVLEGRGRRLPLCSPSPLVRLPRLGGRGAGVPQVRPPWSCDSGLRVMCCLARGWALWRSFTLRGLGCGLGGQAQAGCLPGGAASPGSCCCTWGPRQEPAPRESCSGEAPWEQGGRAVPKSRAKARVSPSPNSICLAF